MLNSEQTFTVYERPEASDPEERVVLLREGFAFWALLFNLLWLMYQRYWAIALFYLAALSVLIMLADFLKLGAQVALLMQTWLNVMLAYYAQDLQGWWLKRKGYRLGGVLVAESAMHAHRRYYEFAR